MPSSQPLGPTVPGPTMPPRCLLEHRGTLPATPLCQDSHAPARAAPPNHHRAGRDVAQPGQLPTTREPPPWLHLRCTLPTPSRPPTSSPTSTPQWWGWLPPPFIHSPPASSRTRTTTPHLPGQQHPTHPLHPTEEAQHLLPAPLPRLLLSPPSLLLGCGGGLPG